MPIINRWSPDHTKKGSSVMNQETKNAVNNLQKSESEIQSSRLSSIRLACANNLNAHSEIESFLSEIHEVLSSATDDRQWASVGIELYSELNIILNETYFIVNDWSDFPGLDSIVECCISAIINID